ELLALYSGQELESLKLQYSDFAQWQYERLTSEGLKSEEEFWLDHFSGQLPILKMPTDYPRPPVQSFEGDRFAFGFGKDLSRRLNLLMRETGTTLYMVLLSIYSILLSKYSDQEDIIVGTPIAGRNHADLANIIGLLLETMAIRNYPQAGKTFEAYLLEVRENTLNAYENQAYPFRELMEQVGDKDDPGRNPIFDVMLLVQNVDAPLEKSVIEDLRAVPYGKEEQKVSKVDLTLTAVEEDDEIFCTLEYCTKLFKRETIGRFAGLFKDITESVVNNRKIKLADIEVSYELVQATSNVYEEDSNDFDF
ncbi:MAG: hypothetical protein GY940_07025, partial [bacterium]|nr:hypothetical protein [bacterium]